MAHVRVARDDELEAIERLTLDAYAQYRQDLPEALWAGYEAELAGVAERAASGTTLVATDHDEIVGAAFMRVSARDPGVVYFRYLAVSPSGRGRGVGVAIMQEAVELARAGGAHTLEWRTASFMAPARRLYERMGHRPVDEERVAPDVVVYRYRLALS